MINWILCLNENRIKNAKHVWTSFLVMAIYKLHDLFIQRCEVTAKWWQHYWTWLSSFCDLIMISLRCFVLLIFIWCFIDPSLFSSSCIGKNRDRDVNSRWILNPLLTEHMHAHLQTGTIKSCPSMFFLSFICLLHQTGILLLCSVPRTN